jgi:hypothetical protein
MATPRQIEANRRNAQKSTGPKTIQGKAAVSLNGLRHGIRTRRTLLPGEDHDEFQRLWDDLTAQWQPLTGPEQFAVEKMAAAAWKFRRLDAAEPHLYAEALAFGIQIPRLVALWDEQCRAQGCFARAQHQLECMQASRGVSVPRAPRSKVPVSSCFRLPPRYN